MSKHHESTPPIHVAMNAYAPTEGIWQEGVAAYERESAQYRDRALGRRAGVLSAIEVVEIAARQHGRSVERPAEESLEVYWGTYWQQVNDTTRIHESEVIYQGKGRESYVTASEYGNKSAVTKHATASTLRHELSILSSIGGHVVPEVYAYSEGDNGDAEMTLERLSGESLDKRIKLDRKWNSVPLPETDSQAIAIGLVDALQHISDAGYLYRDMNLDHIVVEDTPTGVDVRLIDVESSLRKRADGTAAIESHRGTWETMSPEEFQDDGVMSEAMLVYTVGAVLAQLLSGKSQFFIDIPNLDVHDLSKAAEYVHTAYPNPNIPNELGVVVARALQPDAKDRPQSLQELRHAIERARPDVAAH